MSKVTPSPLLSALGFPSPLYPIPTSPPHAWSAAFAGVVPVDRPLAAHLSQEGPPGRIACRLTTCPQAAWPSGLTTCSRGCASRGAQPRLAPLFPAKAGPTVPTIPQAGLSRSLRLCLQQSTTPAPRAPAPGVQPQAGSGCLQKVPEMFSLCNIPVNLETQLESTFPYWA